MSLQLWPAQNRSSQPDFNEHCEGVHEQYSPSTFLPNPHDAHREPSWRWLRAAYLLQHGRPPLDRFDDHQTRAAWLFRRALASSHGDGDQEQLVRNFPNHTEAHAVFTSADPLRRAEVEARLLAGQPNDEIACKCGISASGVEAYHDTFYEVRPHLHAFVYIVCFVIGPKSQCGLQPADHPELLKLAGYHLGGMGVDRMLDYILDPPIIPTSLHGLDDVALQKLHEKLHTHALVMALTIPADLASIARLNEMRQLVRLVQARIGMRQTRSVVHIATALNPLETTLDPAPAMSAYASYAGEIERMSIDSSPEETPEGHVAEEAPARKADREMALA